MYVWKLYHKLYVCMEAIPGSSVVPLHVYVHIHMSLSLSLSRSLSPSLFFKAPVGSSAAWLLHGWAAAAWGSGHKACFKVLFRGSTLVFRSLADPVSIATACMHVSRLYICMYVKIHVHTHMCIYVCIYIQVVCVVKINRQQWSKAKERTRSCTAQTRGCMYAGTYTKTY